MFFSVRQLVLFAVFVVFIQPITAFAQRREAKVDSLLHGELPTLTVSATRIDQALNFQPTKIDVIPSKRMEVLFGLTMGQVLSMEAPLFVKSNGPGGLATISQRGLSPGQTQVLWEGIPINSVVLGMTDFSLIPAGFFTSVEISSGTPSSAFGGGGLAGSIYMNSDIGKRKNVSLKQSVGSFGNYQTAVQAGFHQKNWKAGIKALYSYAQNDFTYYNPAFGSYEQRTHNRTEQFQLMVNAAYQSGDHHFDTNLWMNDIQNKIPGKITKRNSKAWQNNQAVRWLSRYQTNVDGAHLTIKNYLQQTHLNYFNPEIGIESTTQTQRWLLSVAAKKNVADWLRLKGEVSSSIAGVESSNYAGNKNRRKLSVLFNPVLFLLDATLRIYPAVRVDHYSDFGTEASPSLGLNYELIKHHLFLRGQVSQNFNPPTFNDLYWPKAGNPKLKPEQSLNIELGTVIRFKIPFLRRVELSVYQIDVDQGIRWFPNNGGTFVPSNIQDIRVRGFEVATQSRWMLTENMYLKWNQKLSRTRSEITSPRFTGDAAVGTQMRYVPEWGYQTSLAFHRSWLTALFYYRWTGRRYITVNESINNSLDPYGAADFILEVKKTFGAIGLTGNFRVKNVFDQRYQIIKWYPMPGRNYHFSLTVNYNF